MTHPLTSLPPLSLPFPTHPPRSLTPPPRHYLLSGFTRLILPLLLIILTSITVTVILIYTFSLHRALPPTYMLGTCIAFSILFFIWGVLYAVLRLMLLFYGKEKDEEGKEREKDPESLNEVKECGVRERMMRKVWKWLATFEGVRKATDDVKGEEIGMKTISINDRESGNAPANRDEEGGSPRGRQTQPNTNQAQTSDDALPDHQNPEIAEPQITIAEATTTHASSRINPRQQKTSTTTPRSNSAQRPLSDLINNEGHESLLRPDSLSVNHPSPPGSAKNVIYISSPHEPSEKSASKLSPRTRQPALRPANNSLSAPTQSTSINTASQTSPTRLSQYPTHTLLAPPKQETNSPPFNPNNSSHNSSAMPRKPVPAHHPPRKPYHSPTHLSPHREFRADSPHSAPAPQSMRNNSTSTWATDEEHSLSMLTNEPVAGLGSRQRRRSRSQDYSHAYSSGSNPNEEGMEESVRPRYVSGSNTYKNHREKRSI